MFVPRQPQVGFTVKSRGWTVEVKGEREISVEDPNRGFCDVGRIDEDGQVHYSYPEHVPKDVRQTVVIISRRLMARRLHG
jgi:hypothetical protein